jgi:hypothetical protein
MKADDVLRRIYGGLYMLIFTQDHGPNVGAGEADHVRIVLRHFDSAD